MKPQTLKGFNDYFAEDVKLRKFVIGVLERNFEKYGYEPLETPALEYSELIMGQSGEEAEKQYYRFKDPGGRDVMLKYEVMISMCRAVATNLDKITFPYKRYQIQPVWRSENTQKGRERQFTQADADTIGSLSMIADAEFIQMGLGIVKELGFKDFVARISNRKFLDGLRTLLGIPSERFYGMCMSLDKLKKVGRKEVERELIGERRIEKDKAGKIIELINPENYRNLTNEEILNSFQKTVGKNNISEESLRELEEIFSYLKKSGVDEKFYRFDPSLARGLASYTGPVWEFEIIDGGVGSIAGCGRYDNAIGKYLGDNKTIPATGGSFGIERICEIVKDRKMFSLGKTSIETLVTVFSPAEFESSLVLANELRREGLNTMLYPDSNTKLDKQLKYADKKQIPLVIILGPDEIAKNLITLKNLDTKEQKQVTQEELVSILKQKGGI